MTKDEFRKLFENHLEIAIKLAEEELKFKLPSNRKIALFGLGYSYNSPKDLINFSEALDALYISDEKYFVFIDIAVLDIVEDSVVFFVRPSGHRPRTFDKTWNTPPGNGPFKQLGPERKLLERYKSKG